MPSEQASDFELRLRGEITSAEYVRRLGERVQKRHDEEAKARGGERCQCMDCRRRLALQTPGDGSC